jgi:hypothetical protein
MRRGRGWTGESFERRFWRPVGGGPSAFRPVAGCGWARGRGYSHRFPGVSPAAGSTPGYCLASPRDALVGQGLGGRNIVLRRTTSAPKRRRRSEPDWPIALLAHSKMVLRPSTVRTGPFATARRRAFMECGGERSATPLWSGILTDHSAVGLPRFDRLRVGVGRAEEAVLTVFRGYRPPRAQPPATVWHPCGMLRLAGVRRDKISSCCKLRPAPKRRRRSEPDWPIALPAHSKKPSRPSIIRAGPFAAADLYLGLQICHEI